MSDPFLFFTSNDYSDFAIGLARVIITAPFEKEARPNAPTILL